MNKLVLAAALICGSIALAGCNAVSGLGQDIKKASEHVSQGLEKAGDKITEVADEHR